MRQPNEKNCSSVSHRDSARNTAARKEEADRRAELRKHAVPGAPARRRILDCEEHGTAPLAAEAETLAEPAERKHERRGDADGLVGRQRPNQHRRDAHGEQRRDERRLAADAVAEVAKERRADRTGHECDREGRERGEGGRSGIGRREEQPRKDEDGGGRVNVEVEELDGRADKAREQDLSGGVDRRASGQCRTHAESIVYDPIARVPRWP